MPIERKLAAIMFTDIAEGNSANLTIAFGKDKKVIKSSFVKLLK